MGRWAGETNSCNYTETLLGDLVPFMEWAHGPLVQLSYDKKLWELLKSHWCISQFVTMVSWSLICKN